MYCKHRGKGDAILFIHGMPTSHMLWDGVIDQLSDHHRCFAIDLPGMGETPFISYSRGYLDRVARQIESLRVHHGVNRWHVVGHDAGSAVAVHYASRFSRHVGCLALLSPAIFPDLKPFYLLNALRKPLLGEVLAPLVHLAFWGVAMRRAIAGESKSALIRRFHEPFRGPAGAWKLMRLVRWGSPEEMLGEIPSRLAALKMPTLIIRGSRDVLPAAFPERAASLVKNSSMLTLDAGHFIPLERSKEVALSLRAFFAEKSTTIAAPIRSRKVKKQADHARVPVVRSIGPVSLKEHRPIAVIS